MTLKVNWVRVIGIPVLDKVEQSTSTTISSITYK